MNESKVLKLNTIFIVGAVGYYFIEVLFRGHSHWSMALCGGICLVGIYYINQKFSHMPYGIRALIGAALITTVEFTAGCILNVWLGWNVWCYSNLPLNFMGQISLLFSCIWFFLSFGVCLIFSLIERKRKKIDTN